MLNTLLKLLLVSSFVISANSFASCEVTNRVKITLAIDDVVKFAINNDRSISSSILKEKGYENYEEYSYSEKFYSKALIRIIENNSNIGIDYKKAINARVQKNSLLAAKVLMKLFKRCGQPDKDELLNIELIELALSGENAVLERELVKLDADAIVGAIK